MFFNSRTALPLLSTDAYITTSNYIRNERSLDATSLVGIFRSKTPSQRSIPASNPSHRDSVPESRRTERGGVGTARIVLRSAVSMRASPRPAGNGVHSFPTPRWQQRPPFLLLCLLCSHYLLLRSSDVEQPHLPGGQSGQEPKTLGAN